MDSNPRRQVPKANVPVEITNPAGRPAGLLIPPYETRQEKGENMKKKGNATAAPKTGGAGDKTIAKAAIIGGIRNRATGDSNRLFVFALQDNGTYAIIHAKGDTRSNAGIPAPPTTADCTNPKRWVNGLTPVPGAAKVYATLCQTHGAHVYAITRFIGNTARRYTAGSPMLIQALRLDGDGNPRTIRRGFVGTDADGISLEVQSGVNTGNPGEGFTAQAWCPGCTAATDNTKET